MARVEVKRVSVRGRAGGADLCHLIGGTIEIVLSNGNEIDIELFERNPGQITARSDGGSLIIEPIAANTIRMEVRE
jgi:hypothetical protein